MGCASSVESCELELDNPSHETGLESFKGALIVTVTKRTQLERSVRASMALRATYATPEVPPEQSFYSSSAVVNEHNVWKVEAEIAKKGSYLNAGVNRLEFELPLGNKIAAFRDVTKDDSDAYSAVYPTSWRIKYKYVIRVGSLQLKEFVCYPELSV